MKKYTIVIICSLILTSCGFFKGNGVDFEIKNSTGKALNEVQIKTTDGSVTPIFDEIKSEKSVSGFLKMENDKNDGSYILNFQRGNEQIVQFENGYYSNGTSSDHKIIFEVKTDTVIFKRKNYY